MRDLLDSLYRSYPSGTILVWETDQEMPSRDLAVDQGLSPFKRRKLLTKLYVRVGNTTQELSTKESVEYVAERWGR